MKGKNMVGNKIKEQFYLYKAKKLDPDAFAKVYDLFVNKIYRYIFFKVSSVQEAQDLTSEVFLKTWQYLQKEKKEVDNLQALLYQIAKNCVIDFYRQREKRNTVDIDSVAESVFINQTTENMTDKLFVKMQTKEVYDTLSEMNDLYREVIILKYIDQLSVKEVATIINKSSGATRVLLHRAMAVLKKLLAKKIKK
jgi:RNA polymerase sigma-70 factor (ECF subfamily)